MSNHIVAFANADGGTLVIGIEDDSTVTGIDGYQNNINDILRVPFDYCKPSIRITTETIDCVDKDGKPNHLLVISIPQSSELHANQQDDVYYRMGDKSKKLNFDERLQLMYPVKFKAKPLVQKYEDPYKQAEYAYSLIESEV